MKADCSSNKVSGLRPGASSIRETLASVFRNPGAICRKALAATLAGSLLCAFSLKGSELPTPLNGAAPRPFYIIGHNPNTIEDVLDALAGGCNALEPDISQINDCNGKALLIDFD